MSGAAPQRRGGPAGHPAAGVAGAGRLAALGGPAAPGAAPPGAELAGAKAARLAAAHRAGLPVLPGWVVPVSESLPAVRAAAAAVRGTGLAAGRQAALRLPVEPGLAAGLRAAVRHLGGRVIVRSSSPLEDDTSWSGAFSSVAEVGEDDVAAAVRSCWAAAFAVDPLGRLAACGLPLEALALGLVIQPELRPDAGGVAWLADGEVTVEGVAGHPAALLSGWAEGAQARLALRAGAPPRLVSDTGLAELGPGGGGLAAAVAGLACRARDALGDDLIEWAVADGTVWLLQSARRAGPAGQSAAVPAGDAGQGVPLGPGGPARDLAAREWMPLLAAVTRAQGRHVPARPAVPGTAAGRLVACRPHERPAAATRDAILLIGRPVPALAPLLFGARGVIARAGAAGSHLAEVARSLGVPMVTGCKVESVLGHDPARRDMAGQEPGGPGAPAPGTGGHGAGAMEWIAAIDGTAGDVALLPAPAISWS